MLFYDAHAHLPQGDERFFDEIFRRERVPAGTISVCATSEKDAKKLVKLQEIARSRGANLEIAFGLHPWFVDENFSAAIDEIERALLTFPQAQVGEIGLDKCRPNFDWQKLAFARQLALAGTLNRRAIVHCVRAFNEFFEILNDVEKTLKSREREKARAAGTDFLPAGTDGALRLQMHRFAGTPEIARQLLKRFGGNVIFSFLKKDLAFPSPKLSRILEIVPAEQVFAESDAELGLE